MKCFGYIVLCNFLLFIHKRKNYGPASVSYEESSFLEKFRFALVCILMSYLMSSLFFSLVFLPSTLAGEKEVHDLRTDRIKWGNLARRILERIYKDEGIAGKRENTGERANKKIH